MKNENEQVLSPSQVRVEGYIWDVKNVQLLAYVIKTEYETAGMWPADGLDVSEEISAEYTGQPPEGKTLGVAANGMPCWADIPPLSPDQLVATSTAKKAALIAEASAVIAPLKDAYDGNYIEDVDKPRLVAWQRYRYALTQVDTANAVWPEKPVQGLL